jgi:ADP-ribosylglycohydrolase
VLLAGGDTDTNACIAGALVGALVGFNRIPVNSRARVLGHQSGRPAFLHASTLLDSVPRILQRKSET